MEDLIKISYITKNKLKKSIYFFTFGDGLEYIGNITMHRDSKKESWNKILNDKTSINSYTRSGYKKCEGGYNLIKNLPPCPSQIVKKAKIKFIKNLKTTYTEFSLDRE